MREGGEERQRKGEEGSGRDRREKEDERRGERLRRGEGGRGQERRRARQRDGGEEGSGER